MILFAAQFIAIQRFKSNCPYCRPHCKPTPCSVTSSGANRAQASRRWRWPTEEKKLSYQLEETEQITFCGFFPTCQVRVVRFYVSCLLLLSSPLLVSSPPLLSSSSCSTATLDAQWSLSDLNHDHPRPVFPAGPQPRPSPPVFPAGPQPRVSPPSVPCRTSTTTIPAQCSLPDLNHDHPRPVFPAGPQPRVSPPSVPCRTSTTTIHAQCSLPDLNREYPRQKICHIECQKICQIEC